MKRGRNAVDDGSSGSKKNKENVKDGGGVVEELKEDEDVVIEGKSGGQLFYEKKLVELAKEEKSVKNGTHQAVKAEEAELAQERDRALRNAEITRDLRIREIEELYKYDCKAARESYQNALKDFESKILGEVKESIKRLEDLRDGITEAEVRASSRKLRSKRGDGGDDDENMDSTNETNSRPGGENKKSGLGGFGTESLGISFFMKRNDIANDLKSIQRDWKERADKFMSEEEIAEQSVKVVDDALYYNESIMEAGADVVCTTEVTKEEIYGTIQALNSSEVIVKCLDGTQTRVLVSHLRSGRCTIASVHDEE